MVMRSSTRRGRFLRFTVKGQPDDTFLVAGWRGTEELSQLYCHGLDLLSRKQDLDLAGILRQPAALGIKKGTARQGSAQRGVITFDVHGMLSSFEQRDCEDGWVAYHARLVPRVWRLTLDHRNRVFLEKSAPEFIEEVLKESGLSGEDFEFRVDGGKYAKRDYVVQIGESSWSFISRWLEQEGIFYFFEHGEDREKIVFADAAAAYGKIVGDAELPYVPQQVRDKGPGTLEWTEPEAVLSLTCRMNHVAGKVRVDDYNYETPASSLTAEKKVDSGLSEAVLDEYGIGYKKAEEGNHLAEVRKGDLEVRSARFLGQSDCRSLQPGAKFTLRDHYRSDFNQEFMVVAVRHDASVSLQAMATAPPLYTYENDFEAIPASQVFRPERITPRPRIEGSLMARVDAPGDGKYAEVDEKGRYKVKLPFDLSDRKDGKASHPIRMAQPYVGKAYGMHFPLHKGAEVLLTHLGGDPDRPVIAAAVPNEEWPSEVKDQNHTECVLRSAGNNAIVWKDTEGEELWFLHAQKNQEIRVKNDVYEWIENERHLTVKKDQIEHIENDRHEAIDRDLIQKIGADRHFNVKGNDATEVGGKVSLTVNGDVIHSFFANHFEEAKGNFHLKAAEVVVEASSAITLKVGGSSVVVDASGVTIAGGKVTIDGGTTLINTAPGSPPGSVAPLTADTPKEALLPKEPGTSEADKGAVQEVEPAEVSGGAEGLRPGSGAAGAAAAAVAGGEAVSGEEKKKEVTWIEIELLDKKGNPVANEPFRIELPDGSIRTGRLDEKGRHRIDGIKPGTCRVSFPRIDKDKWNRK